MIRTRYFLLLSVLVLLTACGPGPAKFRLPAHPNALALDSEGGTLYIACEAPNLLLACRLPSGRVEKRVPLPAPPQRVYASAGQVRVLCPAAKAVLTYRLPELAPAGTLNLSEPALAWAQAEGSLDLYACPEANAIRPFAGKNPLPDMATGLGPVDLAVDSRSGKVWSANARQNTLTVAQADQGRVLKHVTVWPNPVRLALSGDERMYALCGGQDAVPAASRIQLIDLHYQKAGLQWPAGEDARDLAADRKGWFLVVAARVKGRDSLLTISQATGALLKLERTGRDPRAVAITADGRRAYAACKAEKSVWAHKLDPALREKE